MLRDSLVAINVTQIDKLLNSSTVPFLFYWNGEDNIDTALVNDENFLSFVKEKCMNINSYTSCKLSYFYFKYVDNKEEYNQQIVDLQDVFTIQLNEAFMLEYLITIFKKMHVDFLKVKYSSDIMFDTSDIIIEIYNTIQEKFPSRFVKESVVNYVRSELKKKYSLNSQNTNFVIDYLENIIKDQK